MFKKLFLLSATAFAALTIHAACSINEDEDDEGRKIIYMENSRIKVGLMPECNGRISELILKDGDDERHFFPELLFQTLEVDDGISLVGKTNFAGLEDWGWEAGAVKKNIPYTAKIVKNTPAEVSITLKAEFGAWAYIERTMTIFEDSAVVKVAAKFTNRTDQPFTSSYWQHIMLDFDQDMNVRKSARFITPIRNGKAVRFRNKLGFQNPGFDCLLDRPAISENPKADEISCLLQPWRAVTHDDLMIGMIIPEDQLDKDFGAYHFSEDDSLSIENVFAPVTYAPGASHTIESVIVVSKSLEKVDYIDENVIAGCAVNGSEVKITALRSGKKSDFTLAVEAVDNSGKVVETVSTAAKLPASGEPFAAVLKFKKNISSCKLYLKVTGKDGKLLAKSELLKQLKW